MTFEPGDKVKYKDRNPHSEWHGWEGTVQKQFTSVTEALTTKPSQATRHGEEVHLTTDNLELVAEPTFTFADIQVGDEIRRSVTRPSGTTEVRGGVVLGKTGVYATDASDGGYILAYNSDGDPAKPQVVLTLLNRPEPPHWTESKPIGSVGVIVDGEHTKVLTKESEYRWYVLYATTGTKYLRTSGDLRKKTVTPEQEALLTWIK